MYSNCNALDLTYLVPCAEPSLLPCVFYHTISSHSTERLFPANLLCQHLGHLGVALELWRYALPAPAEQVLLQESISWEFSLGVRGVGHRAALPSEQS